MFVPLPNLDDRRFTDLVDEALSRIPVLAPTWTDFNESDPGITLLELFAWITESDLYRLNRIPDLHRRAFLALVGVRLQAAVPAFAAVQFRVKVGPGLALPAGTQLDATLLHGGPGKFRLVEPLTVLASVLSIVQVHSGGSSRDVTGSWTRRDPVALFGLDPKPGDALYLTFQGDLFSGDQLSLYFELAGVKASRAERQRILDEVLSRIAACPPTRSCSPDTAPPVPHSLPPHHSVVLAWDLLNGPATWVPLAAADDTRSLTLSGSVRLTLPNLRFAQPVNIIRCRIVAGAFDTAPLASAILDNAAPAEQCTPLWETWPILAGVLPAGTPSAHGQPAPLGLALDAAGQLTALDFDPPAGSAFTTTVLADQPPGATAAGSLTLEAVRAAIGTGAPNQLYPLLATELCGDPVSISTLEDGKVQRWAEVHTFVDSGPADPHFLLDPASAQVLFGDGQNGRVVPNGVPILAVASTTTGSLGNASPGTINALDPGPHNAATFHLASAIAQLESIANPDPARDGADPETLEHAEGRAALLVTQPERAVTLADCEALALTVPGTMVYRAAAIANHIPGLACYAAPGVLTVVIVPSLPLGRPVPSAGLLGVVSSYLTRRSVLGTRIVVTGPLYLEVSVNASIAAVTGQKKSALQAAVLAALTLFLDPLQGGPDGTGWPLGRAVYVSEVLDVIAAVEGVDHVISLTLTATGCDASCGDICLNPLALAVSGTHTVQVS